MAYIGRTPSGGRFAKMDDISSGFNGSANTFSLSLGGDTPNIASDSQVIISVGGVIQEPETDFSIRSFKGGFDNNLSYLVSCLGTGNQLIVDAALPLKELRPFINRRGLIAVMITHTHGDHIQYLKEYVDAYPNLVAIIFKESKDILFFSKTIYFF